ncbi:MAG: VOC family protein [Actinomycetales bacterium]|nr:VOC family protein [Actinomycetales bacterium]
MPNRAGTGSAGTGGGIGHVEIGASDLERSVDFYRDLLGFRPVEGPQDVGPRVGRVRWLSAGPALIALVAAGEGGTLGGWVGDDLQRGLRHVGFRVGDVPLQAERLRDAGVRFVVEPLEAVGGVRLAFFPDPDGTLLEIVDRHLTYHEIMSAELAERERLAAVARPREAGPAFDHVAVTVADLDATLALYRDRLGYQVIGRLDQTQDPRGFTIHYLQAGAAVLEVFSFSADTADSPWTPDEDRLGIRGLGLGVPDVPGAADALESAGARPVGTPAAGTAVVAADRFVDRDGVAIRLHGDGDTC